MDEFEEKLTKCYPKMRLWARRYKKNFVEIEDLVQDTMIRALRNRHSFRTGKEIEPWLWVVLRSQAFYNARVKSKRSFYPLDEFRDPLPRENVWQKDNDKERLDELIKRIDRLPEKQREVVLLLFFKDMDEEEVAKYTKTSLRSVRANLGHARLMLKRR